MDEQLQSLTRQLKELTEALRAKDSSLEAHSAQLRELSNAADAFARQEKGHLGFISEVVGAISLAPALALLANWGAFKEIPRGGAISYQELADKVGADVALITRLSWILVASGVLKQVGDDKVAHTPLSSALASGRFDNILQIGLETHMRVLTYMPEYFARYGRREPTGQLDTIYAFAMGDPSLTVWEHMSRDGDRMRGFMASMSTVAASMGGIEAYDLSWVVEAGKEDSERALVVDVGGGKGHELEAIQRHTPGLDMSRCVLEDLPVVVEESRTAAQGELQKARFVATDFHVEQPVEGALLYHIRRCLHDYGDDVCVGILKQIRDVMRRDSRLVIVEKVIDNPPSAIDAASDLYMAALGGKERTLEGFRDITGRAGFEITEVFRGGNIAVVECVPV